MNRIERRKQETRQRIIDAAMDLFTEQGVNNTPVSAIIQQADIAHKTFFNHFPTKNHLLIHIAGQYAEYAFVLFKQAGEKGLNPAEKLSYSFYHIAKGLSALDSHHKALVCYILIGIPDGPDDIKVEQRTRLQQAIRLLLEEAQQQEMLKPGFELDTLVEVVMGLFVVTMMNWANEDEYPMEANMKKMVAFIKQSIFVTAD